MEDNSDNNGMSQNSTQMISNDYPNRIRNSGVQSNTSNEPDYIDDVEGSHDKFSNRDQRKADIVRRFQNVAALPSN